MTKVFKREYEVFEGVRLWGLEAETKFLELWKLSQTINDRVDQVGIFNIPTIESLMRITAHQRQ